MMLYCCLSPLNSCVGFSLLYCCLAHVLHTHPLPAKYVMGVYACRNHSREHISHRCHLGHLRSGPASSFPRHIETQSSPQYCTHTATLDRCCRTSSTGSHVIHLSRTLKTAVHMRAVQAVAVTDLSVHYVEGYTAIASCTSTYS